MEPTLSKKIILVVLSLTGFAFGTYLLVGAIKTILAIFYISSEPMGVNLIRRVLAGLLLVTLRVVITLVFIFPYCASLWREAFPEE